MQSSFDPVKATAAAAFLLRLRGGRMSYLKLIKLLYLADREAFGRWGYGITTDRYVSMDHGPVVSNIYRLITDEERAQSSWGQYISPPLGNYEIELRSDDAPGPLLSRAEEQLLTEIFATFGTWNRWKLVEYTHGLPEWKDPKGSSIPISIDDILEAQGMSETEVREALSDLEAAERANALLGNRI